ncbi:hypothetical protein ES695_02820 [Candidatus Atribacteria bacterium 1244-E10-H5-B2]|nr:MAG: hypothetical protein ES695_02820 [Candidatus Atribacteria bacterium 1244-E10-H5-B2]
MEKEVVDYDFKSQFLEERKEKIERGFNIMKTFNEETFLRNRPEWEKDLFKEINNFLLTEIKQGVKVNYLETYTRYSYSNLMFCKMKSTSEALKIYLKLRYSELVEPASWVRDYEPISRQTWIEVTIREQDLIKKAILLDNVFELIKKAFNRVLKQPGLSKVSVGKPEKILPGFVIPTKTKIDLEISTDGFCQLGIRVHKSQLQKILGKLIE